MQPVLLKKEPHVFSFHCLIGKNYSVTEYSRAAQFEEKNIIAFFYVIAMIL